jgi:hypothetical protein
MNHPDTLLPTGMQSPAATRSLAGTQSPAEIHPALATQSPAVMQAYAEARRLSGKWWLVENCRNHGHRNGSPSRIRLT